MVVPRQRLVKDGLIILPQYATWSLLPQCHCSGLYTNCFVCHRQIFRIAPTLWTAAHSPRFSSGRGGTIQAWWLSGLQWWKTKSFALLAVSLLLAVFGAQGTGLLPVLRQPLMGWTFSGIQSAEYGIWLMDIMQRYCVWQLKNRVAVVINPCRSWWFMTKMDATIVSDTTMPSVVQIFQRASAQTTMSETQMLNSKVKSCNQLLYRSLSVWCSSLSNVNHVSPLRDR